MIIETPDGRRVDTAKDLSAAERHVLQKLLAWRDLATSVQQLREKTADALARGWDASGPVRPSRALSTVIEELERQLTLRLRESRAPDELTQVARQRGASEATVIAAADIVVEQRLADLCVEPRCPNYGLATSCPPHVSGPAGFRELQQRYEHAVVFKLDLDTEILLSDEVQDYMRLLHEIASAVERAARTSGFPGARSFVGGSCKRLFCHEHDACQALEVGGECRHPELAHSSMSGYGINASKLMESAGWRMLRHEPGTKPAAGSQGTICGLVLVSRG